MDRALETRYSMRGVMEVVRTEWAGDAARTQKAHTRACKAAVERLTDQVRDGWLAELDARLKRWGIGPQEASDVKALRRRVAGASYARDAPSYDAFCRVAPYRRTYSDAELGEYRTEES